MQNHLSFGAPLYTTIGGFIENIFPHKDASVMAMLETIPTPVLLTDRDFVITHANKKSLEMFRKLPAAGSFIGCSLERLHRLKEQRIISMRSTMLTNVRGEFDGAFIDWTITIDATERF